MNPTRYKLFLMRQIGRRVADLGLSEGYLHFLLALDAENGISLRELTKKAGVHKSLTTRMVKGLIGNGFVVDTREGGKEYSVILTEKGLEAKRRYAEAHEDVVRLLLDPLSEDERRELFRIVGRIHERMEEMERRDTG